MPHVDSTTWSDCLRHALEHYDEPLLRQVSNRLCKPRNQWPTNELIERCVAAAGNPAIVAYANRTLPSDRIDVAFATIFPSMTILKILCAQIAISLLNGSSPQ